MLKWFKVGISKLFGWTIDGYNTDNTDHVALIPDATIVVIQKNAEIGTSIKGKVESTRIGGSIIRTVEDINWIRPIYKSIKRMVNNQIINIVRDIL